MSKLTLMSEVDFDDLVKKETESTEGDFQNERKEKLFDEGGFEVERKKNFSDEGGFSGSAERELLRGDFSDRENRLDGEDCFEKEKTFKGINQYPNILFVCTGNTCRSAMAEYLAKDKFRAEIKSAGLATSDGFGMTEEAIAVLSEIGIDGKRHKSTRMTRQIFEWADVIVAMTEQHKQILISQYGQEKKIWSFAEIIFSDVADPYGCSSEIYRQTRQVLEYGLDKMATKMLAEGINIQN